MNWRLAERRSSRSHLTGWPRIRGGRSNERQAGNSFVHFQGPDHPLHLSNVGEKNRQILVNTTRFPPLRKPDRVSTPSLAMAGRRERYVMTAEPPAHSVGVKPDGESRPGDGGLLALWGSNGRDASNKMPARLPIIEAQNLQHSHVDSRFRASRDAMRWLMLLDQLNEGHCVDRCAVRWSQWTKPKGLSPACSAMSCEPPPECTAFPRLGCSCARDGPSLVRTIYYTACLHYEGALVPCVHCTVEQRLFHGCLVGGADEEGLSSSLGRRLLIGRPLAGHPSPCLPAMIHPHQRKNRGHNHH